MDKPTCAGKLMNMRGLSRLYHAIYITNLFRIFVIVSLTHIPQYLVLIPMGKYSLSKDLVKKHWVVYIVGSPSTSCDAN